MRPVVRTDESIAIPFIIYDPETGFSINDEAVDFLNQVKQKIGVIAVCGKYRTGKSYLLNKLFFEHIQSQNKHAKAKSGFGVGPTINPCTKGLWLMREFFYSPNDPNKELPILLIDTEGLGAFDEEENHDAKIFLLALLLCSLLVFNSIGAVDENALENLALVLNLSKNLQVKAGQKIEDPDEMAQYFPSFLWVLRDFALQLVDQDGNEINQKTYLENSLRDAKGLSDAVERKNRVRRMIRHFFKERDCFTMVRPMEDERMLQNLAKAPDDMVRDEFVKQVDLLRSKTLKKVTAKQLKGKAINGPMLVELARAYIEALNKGKVPTIDLAWDNVQAAELHRALQEATKAHQQILEQELAKLPVNEETLLEIFKFQK